MDDISINTTAEKIETMANKIIDNMPVENSQNLITSGAVFDGLSEKVDKIEGKGLSTNDYTTADKEKLSGIEAEANKTIIDTDLSRTSANPIQNKAIYKYVLNNIPYITEWMSNPIAMDTIIFVRLYLSNQVVFRVKSSDTFTVEGTVYSFNEGILCLTSEDNGGNIIATNFSSLGNIKILTGTEPIATEIFSVTHYPPYTNDDKTLVDTVTNKADTTDVLTKTNTTEFTPAADYQPATKKYVDIKVGWRVIYDTTLTSDTDVISIVKDINNNSFSLKQVRIDIQLNTVPGQNSVFRVRTDVGLRYLFLKQITTASSSVFSINSDYLSPITVNKSVYSLVTANQGTQDISTFNSISVLPAERDKPIQNFEIYFSGTTSPQILAGTKIKIIGVDA